MAITTAKTFKKMTNMLKLLFCNIKYSYCHISLTDIAAETQLTARHIAYNDHCMELSATNPERAGNITAVSFYPFRIDK